MLLEQLWWALGLLQGLAWSVVLHVRGWVSLTPRSSGWTRPRGAGGPKPCSALGHSRKNVTIEEPRSSESAWGHAFCSGAGQVIMFKARAPKRAPRGRSQAWLFKRRQPGASRQLVECDGDSRSCDSRTQRVEMKGAAFPKVPQQEPQILEGISSKTDLLTPANLSAQRRLGSPR